MILMLFLYKFVWKKIFCAPRPSLKKNLFSVTRLMVLRMGRSEGKLFLNSAGIEKKIILKLNLRKKLHLF